MLRKKRLDIVVQLQVYVYVNSTPIFTYIIYMYTDVESTCAINAPAQPRIRHTIRHAHAYFISEFTTVVVYFFGGSIRLVTYAPSPATYNRLHHNQGTEEGPKRDWPSELIPAWVWKLRGQCSMDRVSKHTVKLKIYDMCMKM